MSDKAWKVFERRIGGMLGLPGGRQRVGPTGALGFDVKGPSGLQVRGACLGVECKYRADGFPEWLTGAVEQAQAHKAFEDDPEEEVSYDPVVALGSRGNSKEAILCVLPLEDYLTLRRRAAAWEGALSDIRGLLAEVKVEYWDEVTLNNWRRLLYELRRIVDRHTE